MGIDLKQSKNMAMKKLIIYITLIPLLFVQTTLGQSFQAVIQSCDSLLFDVGFNQCNLKIMERLLADDLEFYHDINGKTTGKAAFLETFQNGICKPGKVMVARREHLGSEFYPLRKEGNLYAVWQEGKHRFSEIYPDGKISLGSEARFSHLWVKQDGLWKLQRSVSFDHKMPGTGLSQKLEAYLKEAYRQNRFNGAAYISQGGRVLLSQGFGYRDFNKKLRHNAHSIFSIYSITKTFTAEVILQMVEEKKLSLDDSIQRFFPDLQKGKDIRIRHLMSHTSGLFNYTDEYSSEDYSQKAMVAFLNAKPLNFTPGSQFTYCNSGYTLLGFIAELIDKKPFAEILQERVFTPAGMEKSGFDFKNLNDTAKSTPYRILNQKVQMETDIYPSGVAFSGGAIYATVEDLGRYHRALSDRMLLGSRLQHLAYQPVKGNYGLGWMKDSIAGLPWVWHNGGAKGFRSVMLRNEEKDICIVLLGNTEMNLEKLGFQLAAIGLHKLPATRESLAISAEDLEAFEGCFMDNQGLVLRFRKEKGGLWYKAPESPDQELVYEGQQRFFDVFEGIPLRFSELGGGKFQRLVVQLQRGEIELKRKALQFGLVGSATPKGWEGPDIPLKETAPGRWEGVARLKKGEVKIRANNHWWLNYGGSLTGIWTENGPNCSVEAGTYAIIWDENEQTLRLKKP